MKTDKVNAIHWLNLPNQSHSLSLTHEFLSQNNQLLSDFNEKHLNSKYNYMYYPFIAFRNNAKVILLNHEIVLHPQAL